MKEKPRYVIAGDVGGTRARFALFELGKAPRLLHQDIIPSQSTRSFETALETFLHSTPRQLGTGRLNVVAASFGIAGPVVDQRVRTTNLPWQIDARKIAKVFRIPKVRLLNDLVAVGTGALAAPPSKLAIIRGGRPKRTGGTLAVIAAGTGLGEAVFVWDGSEHIACPTEGAHVDFAPRSDDQDELLAELREEHGHVSYERIASGSTIGRVYAFFAKKKALREPKEIVQFLSAAPDRNAAICDLAISGRSEAAMRAIELWSSVYGAEAGNLALKSMSTAGVFVCGGVSARLASVLASGLPPRMSRKRNGPSPFVEAFLAKGRMRAVLETIPVAVCLEPQAGLVGAASHAASLAGGAGRP